MGYGPHTDADRATMLAALGIDSVDALFEDIPPAVRASGIVLPGPEPELTLATRLQALAGRNRVDLVSFLGAGAYEHFIPPAVDQILSRGEFYTSYTPYQPEISQGTLQTIYEYQSLLAELTGLDVVSASHYDGASATAEAALIAVRATRRERLLVSRAVHPDYVETTRTYLEGGDLALELIPTDRHGATDLAALERMLAEPGRPVGGVILAQPNLFGVLEAMPDAAALAHAAGALFVAVVEPVSLAVLAPPGAYGADIAAGEGQPLGIPLQYGGPYLGVLATTQALVRQIPGRLVGRTTDLEGRRAFVMTLRAREQDIRREKAASNICTNQALCALAATVYLATVGPHGLRDVARLGAARARELERALAAAGAPRVHDGPYLNEFCVRVPDAERVHAALVERGILAGLPLARWFPGDPMLRDALLVCATELTTPDGIARFAEALRGVAATDGTAPDGGATRRPAPVGAGS